jgi:hypothetical protein
MLERYAMKVARTVLRGGSDSNATPLPDYPSLFLNAGRTGRGRQGSRYGGRRSLHGGWRMSGESMSLATRFVSVDRASHFCNRILAYDL